MRTKLENVCKASNPIPFPTTSSSLSQETLVPRHHHVYTETHIWTRAHTCAYKAHTHSHTCVCTHALRHMCTYAHRAIHTCSQTRTHTHSHADRQTDFDIHSHTHMLMRSPTIIYTYMECEHTLTTAGPHCVHTHFHTGLDMQMHLRLLTAPSGQV